MASLQLPKNYREFLRCLDKDVKSLPECEAVCIKPALEFIAKDARIAKATSRFIAPTAPLRKVPVDHSAVLYENPAIKICSETFQSHFALPDGGSVDIVLWPDGEPFTEVEKDLAALLSKQMFEKCSRLAMYMLLQIAVTKDAQTGSETNVSFMRRIGSLLKAGQLSNYTGAFFNIHNFKYVNKAFSYADGDIILRNYAETVMKLLTEGEILARLGGDNFLLLLHNEHAPAVFNALKKVNLTYSDKNKTVDFVFGATAGTAVLANIHEPRDVMARLSISYAGARRIAPGTFLEFSPDVQKKIMEDQSVLSNFDNALNNGEFKAFYQPKVSLSKNKIVGAEALVRWIRDGKIIPPIAFIPQLEKEGSICRLDFYMLEETCRYLRKRMDNGEEPLCISVNFSRKHLNERNLVKRIAAVVDSYKIPHEFIDIELTESEDYQNYEIMTNVIVDLHAQGIKTSMDDFGTGFSSLNMIKQVNLDSIKIDRSLVPREEEYNDKGKDILMFNSLAQMISQLEKGLVIEGVETPPQLKYLKNAGCDIVQGYIFDKPLPESEFEKRLQTGYPEKKFA